jgi:hypothetical protein
MGLREFRRGEGLGLQAVTGLGNREMGQFGHGGILVIPARAKPQSGIVWKWKLVLAIPALRPE